MKNFQYLLLAGIFFPLFTFGQTKPCSSEAHRQFDFWIGEWNVYHAKEDTLVGHNHIKLLLNDCVIEENWKGAGGFEGKSFNTYNPEDSTWNQVWVDVGGNTYHFKGKFKDNVMRLKGESTAKGKTALFDMAYHYNEKENTVRQIWKMSTDVGKSWNTIFDGIYRKE